MSDSPRREDSRARRRGSAAVGWGRDATARARATAERAREWAEAERERSRVVALAFDLAERDRARLGGLLAGALAYRLFLWVLPFSLFTVGALGAITSIDGEAPERDLGQRRAAGLPRGHARRRCPPERLVDRDVHRPLRDALRGDGRGAGAAHQPRRRLGHAARPRRRRQPVAGLALAPGRRRRDARGVGDGRLAPPRLLRGRSADHARDDGALLRPLAGGLAAPPPPGERRSGGSMPGALVVALGIQGLQLFTIYYLAGRAERAASVYGTIGAALTLLLWLFIIARLMVGGAILNAELSAHTTRPRRPFDA